MTASTPLWGTLPFWHTVQHALRWRTDLLVLRYWRRHVLGVSREDEIRLWEAGRLGPVATGVLSCDTAQELLTPEARRSCMQAYEAHIQAVHRAVPVARLLAFNVKDGWQPLCRFLAVIEPCPLSFPHTKRMDYANTVLSITPVILLGWCCCCACWVCGQCCGCRCRPLPMAMTLHDISETKEDLRCWPPDEPLEGIFARSDAHLRQAHRNAVEGVSQWTSYDAPQGPEEAPEFGDAAQFFFNAITGESRWSDPRQSVEFDLRQRHSILCECIAAHTQNLAKMAKMHPSSDSSEGENDLNANRSVQALVQNLWESIGTLPLPVRREAAPSEAAPPEGARRPAHLPAGDDTVRSSMSYLTARSNASCSPRADLPGRVEPDPLANHPFVLQPAPLHQAL